jgi:hypothetical protein
MSHLPELQRAFQDHLLAKDDRFAALAGPQHGIEVYRDAYALRLIEALTTDYPGLMAMAGPADFDLMARAYIEAHPSRHPSIRWFGSGLADFLGRTPPFSGSPAAVEMARFEWALGEAFDAADAEPVAAETIVALPPEAWETLAFVPLPTLSRLTLAFEVPQAWQRREEVEPGDLEVAAAGRPVQWVIWRPERVSNFRSLDEDEAAMLDAMIERRPFPELCEVLSPLIGEDQAPARAAGLLRSWVEGGMIAGVDR